MFDQSNAASDASQSAAGGQSTSSDEADGEDQDDSSSHSNEYVLANFREQWQRELAATPKKISNNVTSSDDFDLDESYESKAKSYFIKGVEHEQAGKLYEAIQFYKRAVQLVPDIEFKLYESTTLKNRDKEFVNKTEEIPVKSESSIPKQSIKKSELEDMDILQKFHRLANKYGCLCLPEFETQNTHISHLPMEIILYILRWVVSQDLDFLSLEKFGSTCRGFYICSRDSEIWRLACTRVWGVNCGSLNNTYTSWRQMFIERPRLHFNGCYISKTTYIRPGENSFQDQFYRPWHLVEYYRYLRFFPDGLVLMITTPDEPSQCVGHLRTRTPKLPNVLVGHYRLRDRCVTLLVQRQEMPSKVIGGGHRIRRRRGSMMESSVQTFRMDFQIHSHRKKLNSQLTFSSYTVVTKYPNGTETNTNFELVGAKYPPLWFSRVKSYTAESEIPLQ